MAPYLFPPRMLTREVLTAAGRSVSASSRLALTLCVTGVLTFPCLSLAAWAVGRDTAAQQETPPETRQPLEEAVEEPAQLPAKQRDEIVAQVRAAVERVNSPQPRAVAAALGIDLDVKGDEAAQWSSLEQLGDLDGDGVPEMALRWMSGVQPTPENEQAARPLSRWTLFLLAWDGARWRATFLMDLADPFTLQVEPLLGRKSQELIALVQVSGSTAPYPVIFEFKDRRAFMLWDSRADESRYQAFARGQVEFRDLNGDGVCEMLVSGRADPGLLVFSKTGKRGFEARAIYTWDGKAYVPGKTEFSVNEDFTLYRFISALHLHDFRSAYALVEPREFLNTREPSLELFRQQVEATWPEFLVDNIFEAADSTESAADDYTFTLQQEGKLFVYQPAFSSDSKHLLTGLVRREEK